MNDLLLWYHNMDPLIRRDIFISFIFVVILLSIQFIIRKAILAHRSLTATTKQRWLRNVRNTILLFMFAMGLMIWGDELQNFALSLAAVAVACVWATREILLCILGSIFRTGADLFQIGDNIEVNGIKGQVIDMDLFSTTLVEASTTHATKSTTNRVIVWPNSMLFNSIVYNENRLGLFTMQVIYIKLKRTDDWLRAERILLALGNQTIAEYAEKLKRYARSISHIYTPDPQLQEATVKFRFDNEEAEDISLYLQLPLPSRQAGQLKEQIIKTFLITMFAPKTAPDAQKEDATTDNPPT